MPVQSLDYISHLSKDKKLKAILDQQLPIKLIRRKKIHFYLYASIMSQQLSSKVADVILKRFLKLYGGKEPSPDQILETPIDLLRAIGLSNAKTGYIHNVAKFSIEKGIDFHKLDKMDNEEVIAYLTQIKGVGRWTAQMLLISTLGRLDVFAVDDMGIQQAMRTLYKLNNADKKLFREKLLSISEKWKPYRTYACLHLWRWKDRAKSS